LCRKIRNSGRFLILCGTPRTGTPPPDHSRVIDYVGRKNIRPHVTAAISRAQQIHSQFFGIAETMAHDLKNAAF